MIVSGIQGRQETIAVSETYTGAGVLSVRTTSQGVVASVSVDVPAR